MMPAKLTHDDLYSLEQYSSMRPDYRSKIMAHKKIRIVHLGPHAALHFEDRMTMQYQVQEMLRAERIFEAEGIQEELDSYNPLIPDGSNWKATLMLEYDDVEERRLALSQLIGIEMTAFVQVSGFDRVTPYANEDLIERETEDKTSSVHFLRFELTPEMIIAVKNGAAISVGIDHPYYKHEIEALPESIRASLANDLG